MQVCGNQRGVLKTPISDLRVRFHMPSPLVVQLLLCGGMGSRSTLLCALINSNLKQLLSLYQGVAEPCVIFSPVTSTIQNNTCSDIIFYLSQTKTRLFHE